MHSTQCILEPRSLGRAGISPSCDELIDCTTMQTQLRVSTIPNNTMAKQFQRELKGT